MQVITQDLSDAFDHISQEFEISEDAYLESLVDLAVDDYDMRSAYIDPQDITEDWSGLTNWSHGDLADILEEEGLDELVEEFLSFRDSPYWERHVRGWVESGRIPDTNPLVVFDFYQEGEYALGDGRGRGALAFGMGWRKVPAVILTPKPEFRKASQLLKQSAVLLGQGLG